MVEKAYTGYDALRTALEMERKGHDFYMQLAEKVSHRPLKEVFRQLAREEERHIRTMEEKLLPVCHSEEAYWADEELMAAHLERLMAGGIFPDVESVLGSMEESGSVLKALYLAIQVEKDSISLYKKALEAAADEEGKTAFGLLVEEEEKHLQLLYNWQKEMAESGGL